MNYFVIIQGIQKCQYVLIQVNKGNAKFDTLMVEGYRKFVKKKALTSSQIKRMGGEIDCKLR